MNRNVAIIGAGMAGLSCATALAQCGYTPQLFDKGRGPGGRMSARRADIAGDIVRFDHGAQYFSAQGSGFKGQVAEWEQAGAIAPWPAAGEDAWIGTPAMNAPIRAMADVLDVEWGVRIESVRRDDERWMIEAGGRTIACDFLVVAIPAEQVAPLLLTVAPEIAGAAERVQSDPCWSVMAAFAKPLPIADDVLRPDFGPIGWAARDSAKPGRAAGERWVIHATPSHSRAILENSADEVAESLLADFFAQTATAPVKPIHLASHRWRYAMVHPAAGEHPAVWDATLGIGVAGDWLSGPRAENAWISGKALADIIAATS